jgi:hemerythrin-like metal-binding protein
VVVPDDDLAARLRERSESGTASGRLRFRRGDGSTFIAEITSGIIPRPGAEAGSYTIFRDITERTRSEEERGRLRAGLEQAARMSAIGQLAGGVAHDFNNLLTVVLSCVESLRIDAEAGAPAGLEDVDEIRGAAERARDLTRQLLTFARRQFVQPEVLDLNDVVRVSEKLLRRVLGEGVDLRVSLAPELWPARFDRGQMEQVVMNLAVNSRDAMSGKGTLTVETTNLAVHGGTVPDGAYVALRVGDTGTGLSPEARAHLFEPFFTTKARGKGTGLGLATVYGIVKQSRGEIRVESEPGRGTVFEILLPRSLESPAEPHRPLPAVVTRGTETVLLVEDEERLRDLLARALRGAGYRVIVAGNGAETLELGAEAIDQTSILVTDLVMPVMDGRATASALRRRRPSLPVLFVSGYAEEGLHPGELDALTGFLPKPFTPGDLLARIRTMLDGAATPARPASPQGCNALWRPDLATGIREVDMQHRELLLQVAALEGAARAGDLQKADDALAYLERYAVEHFATEERIMRDLGYPELDAHRSLHLGFVAQLGRRKAAHAEARSPAVLLVELGRWMEAWLAEHVMGADAEMARFVRGRTAAAQPVEPG